MRTCLFCDSTDVTLEHVWPQWISKLFHSTPKKGRYKVASDSTLHPPIRRETNIIDQTAKVVCGTCNGGWMKELEDAAKPVLTPMILNRPFASLILDDYPQAVIVTWAIKTAMLFDQTTRKKANKFYTRDVPLCVTVVVLR